jgi:hypothetical protein
MTDRRAIDIFISLPRNLQNVEGRIKGVADGRFHVAAVIQIGISDQSTEEPRPTLFRHFSEHGSGK